MYGRTKSNACFKIRLYQCTSNNRNSSRTIWCRTTRSDHTNKKLPTKCKTYSYSKNIPKEKREDLTLLIDIGDLTTSIAFVKGDGLLGLTSFARGGGFITNDLSEAFNLSMNEADRLKKQIVLSLKGKQNDFYELTLDEGRVDKILLNSANEVVSYRIEELAQVISKCIQMYSREYLTYLPIYLTGAGLSKIKGGRDYLAKCLGKNINYGLAPLPGKDKPELASILSLVSSALQSNENI